MSKVNTNRTVAQLLNFNNQIQSRMNDVFLLMDTSKMSRIREFYKNDGQRIVSWNDKLSELAHKYLVIENDNIVMEEVPDLVDAGGAQMSAGKNRKPKMKEGLIYEDYIKERNAILETIVPCSI